MTVRRGSCVHAGGIALVGDGPFIDKAENRNDAERAADRESYQDASPP